MKTALYAILSAAAFVLTGCGTGTTITFGKGGITVVPPSEPIVIPTK